MSLISRTIRTVLAILVWTGFAHSAAAALAPQTVVFEFVPPQFAGLGPFGIIARSDQHLPITYTSASPEICNVISPNPAFGPDAPAIVLVRGHTAYCTIVATAPATHLVESASATVFFPVRGPQTLTFPQPADQRVDAGSFEVVVTSTAPSQTELYSHTPEVCDFEPPTFSLIGLIFSKRLMLKSPGVCTIRAENEGDALYSRAAGITRTFVVLPAGV